MMPSAQVCTSRSCQWMCAHKYVLYLLVCIALLCAYMIYTVPLLQEEYDYKKMQATENPENFENTCGLGISPVIHDFINMACA